MRVETLADVVTLYCEDCLDALDAMEENSIDSVVCDPPYHLTSIVNRFGKEGSAPAKDYSGEKEGATGAYARASRGFMGKEWDGGDVAFRPETWAEVMRVIKPGGHLVAFSGTRTYHRMAVAIEDAGFEIRDQLAWCYGSGFPKSHNMDGDWQGWGTALKPAWEPIALARKPLSESTVAANVLKWGTGALNIDATRVEGTEDTSRPQGKDIRGGNWSGGGGRSNLVTGGGIGRWPANLAHDGSEEVLAGFPYTKSGSIALHHKRTVSKTKNAFGERAAPPEETCGDSGSAARFFYCAKAGKADRVDSKHPTVKPVSLMRWLVRMVTPPGGTVLDPFAGTGTTGQAAMMEGFRAVMCEREEEYQTDIRRRISLVFAGEVERAKHVAQDSHETLPLFSEAAE